MEHDVLLSLTTSETFWDLFYADVPSLEKYPELDLSAWKCLGIFSLCVTVKSRGRGKKRQKHMFLVFYQSCFWSPLAFIPRSSTCWSAVVSALIYAAFSGVSDSLRTADSDVGLGRRRGDRVTFNRCLAAIHLPRPIDGAIQADFLQSKQDYLSLETKL